MIQQSRGFTLIELVVVILILGILAATALPRFLNVNDQAHSAAVAGAGGGFAAGVALARAGWLAGGNSAAVDDLGNFGTGNIDTDANGWPVAIDDTNATNATQDCIDLWNNLMQNPPTLGATPNDYTPLYAAGPPVTCTYTYNPDATKNIQYTPSTGAVVVTK